MSHAKNIYSLNYSAGRKFIANKMKKGSNATDSLKLLEEIFKDHGHSEDNLTSALVYQGFATEYSVKNLLRVCKTY